MNLARSAYMRGRNIRTAIWLLIESGGDNLAATSRRTSPTSRSTWFDESRAADKNPLQGRVPEHQPAPILVINKIDLARMSALPGEDGPTDAKRMRGERPFAYQT